MMMINGNQQAIDAENLYQPDFSQHGLKCLAWNTNSKNNHPIYKDDTQKVTIQTNNISDWKVGDGVAHDAFGLGVVITIIDTEIIEVMFDTLGKKKLIANHPKLKRRNKEEGLE
jgi:hypothetical protein